MLKFEKYHGLGNDFIIFMEGELGDINYSELAKKVCHRKFGIGSDGMMVVGRSEIGAFNMIFYNADGSRAPMCGNGIRAFTHYIAENKLIEDNVFNVETLAGLLTTKYKTKNEEFMVEVYMGQAKYESESVPVISNKEQFLKETLSTSYGNIELSSIFMGTTHTVVFVEDLDKIDIEGLGKEIENNLIFPVKTNVNFVEVKNDSEIKVNTWERGAGFTYACGTGCCASVVLAHKFGLAGKKVKVEVPGGIMYIELKGKDVYMTGPSEKIAKGFYFY
jgi:diaminopimelate epimerase